MLDVGHVTIVLRVAVSNIKHAGKKCLACEITYPLTLSKVDGNVYCKRHYTQVKRNGKINPPNNIIRYFRTHAVIEVVYRGSIFKVLVSGKDLPRLKNHKWQLDCRGYVHSEINGKKCYIHRFIMNPPNEMWVDHKFHNKLDNRRSELRVTSPANNCRNKRNTVSHSSKYKGVSWSNRDNKWYARCEFNSKGVYIGAFNNEWEAAEAYNSKAIELFGEFACLNIKQGCE